MNVQNTITIDLDMVKSAPPVWAVAGDSGTRSVRIRLRSGMEPWTIPEGVTASLVYKKFDGSAGWYDTLPDGSAACTLEDSEVVAALAPQVLADAGTVIAAVVLQDGDGNRLTTFDFLIDVKSSPAGGDPSEDYYNLHVVNAIQELEARIEALERGGSGESLSVTTDGDALVITTSLPVSTDEDAIVIGGE